MLRENNTNLIEPTTVIDDIYYAEEFGTGFFVSFGVLIFFFQ